MSIEEIKDIDDLKGCVQMLTGLLPRSLYFMQLIKTHLKFGIAGYRFFRILDQDGYISTALISVLEDTLGKSKHYTMFFETKDESLMMDILLQNVDWSKRTIFHCVPEFQYAMIRKVIRLSNVKIIQERSLIVLALNSIANLPSIEYKRTVSVEKLGPEFAEVINLYWRFKSNSSVFWIRQELRHGIGFGAVINGQVVSWILLHRYGTIAYLHTVTSYRHSGCAMLVINEICSYLSRLGITPMAHVPKDNGGSLSLLRKMNFDEMWECKRFVVEPSMQPYCAKL